MADLQTRKEWLMSMPNSIKNMSQKKKIIISVIAVAVVAAIVATCIVVSRNNLLATTMRLLKVQGTVNLEDSKGNSKPVVDNLRFQSGDALITSTDGLASIGLDDTKIVTLQNDSRAEFVKKRKQLQLNLAKGAVFFNVTEKLKADESFEIKTATMTAGIRGTSGIVFYDTTDENRQTLFVTDGDVAVNATNPTDNVTRSVMVHAGQSVKAYFYNNDGNHDSVEFVLNSISPKDLARFNLSWSANDNGLLARICNSTGWNDQDVKNHMTGNIVLPEHDHSDSGKETEPSATTAAPSETTAPAETTAPSETTEPSATTKKTTKKKSTKKATTKKSTKKKKKKTSSAPSIPSGWYSYVWGESYNGHKVYIIYREADDFQLKGYIGGKWVDVIEVYGDGVPTVSFIYNDTVVYYATELNKD